MHAVTGKILRVNLTEGTCTTEAVPDSVYERFLSGIGLAAYYLYQRIPPGADPLGPDNVLSSPRLGGIPWAPIPITTCSISGRV